MRRVFLALCCILMFSHLAAAQMAVPMFGTRGNVDDVFLQSFMTQLRRAIAVDLDQMVSDGDGIITAGIAGSLKPELTQLIAEILQTRYAISGEISKEDALSRQAPYAVRLLIYDNEAKRSSDIISLPVSEENLEEVITSLSKQMAAFLEPTPFLSQGTAGLFISSEPSEADIFIDGVKVAETPLLDVLMLQPGLYEVELRKQGFQPASRFVELTENREMMEQFSLTPVVGGSIQVRSYPRANVLLDGKQMGKTPLTLPALPGTHSLYIERLGFKPIHFNVRVENYRVSRVEPTLEAEDINILFWDVLPSELVYIDNVLQTRDYVSDLMPGTYQINVRSAGETVSFEISIEGEGVYELDTLSKTVKKLN